MNEQNVIYTYNGILFSHKKKHILTHATVNELWKHYTSVKQVKYYTSVKQAATKYLILCDSIFMKCPEQANSQRKKVVV